MPAIPPGLDHVMYATHDLAETLAAIERDWGIAPTIGGGHEDLGSMNALADLGGGAYLEILGPDPNRTVRVDGIEAAVRRATAAGYDPGPIEHEERRTPDGRLLGWELCWRDDAAPVVPFLIDWGATTHPSTDSVKGLRLVALHAEHPEPVEALRCITALGTALDVAPGPAPRLIAEIDTPRGRVTLG